jgi:hypothetical protein
VDAAARKRELEFEFGHQAFLPAQARTHLRKFTFGDSTQVYRNLADVIDTLFSLLAARLSKPVWVVELTPVSISLRRNIFIATNQECTIFSVIGLLEFAGYLDRRSLCDVLRQSLSFLEEPDHLGPGVLLCL